MRTWKMTKNPKDKKDAVLCQYFLTNTTDAKCMYNTANFYIRNTMTGFRSHRRSALLMKQKCSAVSLTAS